MAPSLSPSPRARALMRADLADLAPYDPAFVPARINLSANENTWPISAARASALAASLSEVALNRYPDPLARELREALGARLGLEASRVLVSNGADEGLFNLLLAFGGAGRTALICAPTFEEYRIFSQITGTATDIVWRDADTLALPRQELLERAPEAQLTFLCSPNNPTGDTADLALIRELHDSAPGLLIVDEAYGEFAPSGSSAIALLDECERLVVAKTFSKAFSLAGARCGYLLASADVLQALAAVRQPYSVSAVTQALALASLGYGDEVDELVEAIVAERERLASALSALSVRLPLEVFPSAANFLLLRMAHAHAVRTRLVEEASILVRDFSRAPGLAQCLRVSVGTPAEDDAFVAALGPILEDECDKGGIHGEDR